MWRPFIGPSLEERVKKMGVWDWGPWMVRECTGVDGEWCRMESLGRERGRCGWVGWVGEGVWVYVTVCIPRFAASTFSAFFFFFFLRVNSNLTWVHCSRTVYHCSCTVQHCSCTVHVLKNIKNGFHDTIYTFKNYFATVFSVFSFQFSVFSNNKLNPNGPYECNCGE